LKGKAPRKPGFFSIAKNVAIDHFRKQKGWKDRLFDKFDWDRKEITDSTTLPEDTVIQNEEVKHLKKCLDTCAENHRIVLIMRYLNGLSIAETAEALNWSESKVKTTQHRALKSIRVRMESERRKEDDHHASI